MMLKAIVEKAFLKTQPGFSLTAAWSISWQKSRLNIINQPINTMNQVLEYTFYDEKVTPFLSQLSLTYCIGNINVFLLFGPLWDTWKTFRDFWIWPKKLLKHSVLSSSILESVLQLPDPSPTKGRLLFSINEQWAGGALRVPFNRRLT